MNKWIPTLPEISRETMTVLAAMLISAWILSQFPAVKEFIDKNK